jgi:regulator of sirC expression with transglutaminase-like and TPR domain
MNLDETLACLAANRTTPVDLAEVALHLARDEYPNLDVDAYLSELAGMAREARTYLRGDFAARVAGFRRFLFHELGFHGNRQDYYDPRNSYLNEVVDRRTGIPITLSVVAMALAARTGLDVEGIGLPGHFIIRAMSEGQEILLDPFHGGRCLMRPECEILVQQVTGVPFVATAAHFQPMPPGLIVIRMLNNLKLNYLRRDDHRRAVTVIERLRQLAPDDPEQQRDLGVSLAQLGQPGRALPHLEAYLAAQPKASDAEAVHRLLTRTRSELARWN